MSPVPATPESFRKSTTFGIVPKLPQRAVTIIPRPFLIEVDGFWAPLWPPFFVVFFSKRPKTLIFYDLTILWKVLDLVFIQCSCFYQNPFQRAFLEVQNAGLDSTCRFWCHFRFSWGPKIRHWWPIISQKCRQEPCFFQGRAFPGAPGTPLGRRFDFSSIFHRFYPHC